MKILYFAWLRERAGVAEEDVAPPPEVMDVNSLIAWLKGRGEGREAALADRSAIRVAVNQEYVPFDSPVGPDDEVAFFPPVTGG